MKKIGMGGGCHWCTEAVFQSLKGVEQVEQGYIATSEDPDTFYEGVLVHYDPNIISLQKLVEIHLKTHQSTSFHRMRSKYLSGVYIFNEDQRLKTERILDDLRNDFDKEIITSVYNFKKFQASRMEIRDYYRADPDRPFCRKYIEPKLEMLKQSYSSELK